MTLGALIEVLRTLPPDMLVSEGFDRAYSYRGDYAQLALHPAQYVTMGKMLAVAESALGQTFTGYKGGEFTMHEDVDVYCAEANEGGADQITQDTILAWRLEAEVERLKADLATACKARVDWAELVRLMVTEAGAPDNTLAVDAVRFVRRRAERAEADLKTVCDAAGVALGTEPEDRGVAAVLALAAQYKRLKAIINKGLDYEHHSSCGHVWTMRRTACPECFMGLKADLAAAQQANESKRLTSTALALKVAENDKLKADLEREQIRLAACGVVALANTPDAAVRARAVMPEYRSASLGDVERMVDSEMALRAEVERLKIQLAETHDGICENGHERHEDCTDACSCVGSGKSHLERANVRIEELMEENERLKSHMAHLMDVNAGHVKTIAKWAHDPALQLEREAHAETRVEVERLKADLATLQAQNLRGAEIVTQMRADLAAREEAAIRWAVERFAGTMGLEQFAAQVVAEWRAREER